MSFSDLSPENTLYGVSGNQVDVDTDNQLKVAINNDTNSPVSVSMYSSAFGETVVAQNIPYTTIDPISGFKPAEIETFTSGTGSDASILDNVPGKEFSVSCGTDVGGYGVLRSKKTLDYRPGVGSMGRFTARFTTGVANTIQRAGFFNIGNELTVGYNGTNFAILLRSGGRPEIRKLTINTSSNQSANVTITLNGTAKVIAVTNASAAQNAFEIADAYAPADGWNAYNVGDTVLFQARATGSKNGTYSSSVSGGSFSATFSQLLAGRDPDDTFVNQSSWNVTTLTSGSDAFILDPTKGNVYQIQFQYLGYGKLTFFIENPSNGQMIPVHRFEYANNNTKPSLDIPFFKLGIISASLGGTTNLDVRTGSMAGFHENHMYEPNIVSAASGEQSGISTTLTSVLAIKKITLEGDNFDISDIKVTKISAASEGTKPVIFDVLLNPTFNDDTLWVDTETQTPVVKTSTGGTLTNGRLIYSVALSKSSNATIDLTRLNVVLTNDDVLAIGARATSGNTDTTVTIIWSGR